MKMIYFMQASRWRRQMQIAPVTPFRWSQMSYIDRRVHLTSPKIQIIGR